MMGLITKGMGENQSIVTKGLVAAYFFEPFKEVFSQISKLTIRLVQRSKLWKS